jgi:acetylornithine/N-succinyldiaminopimelate aminotransferase
VGAFVTSSKVSDVLVPGDHGTTYGGNPFATAAVSVVYDLYDELHIIDHVKETGTYLYDELEKMAEKYSCIKEHRGIGLMQGLEFYEPVGPIVKKALEKGLVIISAGANTLRFIPPLVIEKEHVDEMITLLSDVIEELGL